MAALHGSPHPTSAAPGLNSTAITDRMDKDEALAETLRHLHFTATSAAEHELSDEQTLVGVRKLCWLAMPPSAV